MGITAMNVLMCNSVPLLAKLQHNKLVGIKFIQVYHIFLQIFAK